MQQEGCQVDRSEEHTSELQSPDHLVCRLLLEKKIKRGDFDLAIRYGCRNSPGRDVAIQYTTPRWRTSGPRRRTPKDLSRPALFFFFKVEGAPLVPPFPLRRTSPG